MANINNTHAIQLLINSSIYQRILLSIQHELLITINNDVTEHLFTYDVNKLNNAKLFTIDLEQILLNYSFLIKSFVKSKLSNQSVNQTTADYFYSNFLIIYLIELFFLINNQHIELGNYLKSIRIPKSKAYMNEIIRIYNSLKN